jgi:hypothetical protein
MNRTAETVAAPWPLLRADCSRCPVPVAIPWRGFTWWGVGPVLGLG